VADEEIPPAENPSPRRIDEKLAIQLRHLFRGRRCCAGQPPRPKRSANQLPLLLQPRRTRSATAWHPKLRIPGWRRVVVSVVGEESED